MPAKYTPFSGNNRFPFVDSVRFATPEDLSTHLQRPNHLDIFNSFIFFSDTLKKCANLFFFFFFDRYANLFSFGIVIMFIVVFSMCGISGKLSNYPKWTWDGALDQVFAFGILVESEASLVVQT